VVRPADAATSLTPFLHQQYEPLIVKFICDWVPVGGVFMDVGANVGLISLQVLQHIGNEGRVISYEPLPQNVADMTFIRQSAGTTASQWGIETFALSDESGTAHVEWKGEAGWCRISDRGDIEIERRTFDEERLRHQLQFVDCVKIDVEGHEVSVVRGMRASIAAGTIGAVLVELHLKVIGEPEIKEILASFLAHNYRAFVIHGRSGADGDSGAELEEIGVDFFPQSRSHLFFRKDVDQRQKVALRE
jgi:FkbM family methyltransferase